MKEGAPEETDGETTREEYEAADATLVARNVRYAQESDRVNPVIKVGQPEFSPTARAEQLSHEHFVDQKELLGQRADVVSRANEEAIAENAARTKAKETEEAANLSAQIKKTLGG